MTVADQEEDIKMGSWINEAIACITAELLLYMMRLMPGHLQASVKHIISQHGAAVQYLSCQIEAPPSTAVSSSEILCCHSHSCQMLA